MYLAKTVAEFYRLNCDQVKALFLSKVRVQGPDLEDMLQEWWLYMMEEKLLDKYNALKGDITSYIYGCMKIFMAVHYRKTWTMPCAELKDYTEVPTINAVDTMDQVIGFAKVISDSSRGKLIELFEYRNRKALGYDVLYPSKAAYRAKSLYDRAVYRYKEDLL